MKFQSLRKITTTASIGLCLLTSGAEIPSNWNSPGIDESAFSKRITDEVTRIEQQAKDNKGWGHWLQETKQLRSALENRFTSDPGITHADDFFLLPNGYLYSKSWTLDYIAPTYFEEDENGAAAVSSIVKTRDWLSSLGVHLVVVPIPPRMEVTPTSVFDREVSLPHRLHFIQTLLEHGVDTVDVLPPLKEEQKRSALSLSLKLDSHYTSTGVAVVAHHLAEILGSYGFPNPRNRNTARFQTQIVTYNVRSALVKYLPEDGNITISPLEPVQAISVIDDQGNIFKAAEKSSVLISGDSYTYIFEGVGGHLPAQLALELNEPVSHVSMAGGGPSVPRLLVRFGEKRVSEYNVVIWAFTGRYLMRGGWEKNPLLQSKSVESDELE